MNTIHKHINILKFFFVIICFFIINEVNAANIKSSAVVFMYHRFGEESYPSTNIKLDQFEKHLEEFANNNYNVVSLDYIIDSFIAETNLPDKTIAITIDDGYKSILTEAWPRLKAYGFPLTVFVSTDPIDANVRGYLSWDEIRKLKEEGVVIGSHTKTHPHLQNLSIDEIKYEVEYSTRRYMEEIGEVPKYFAYPFGETSDEVIRILKDYKFLALFGQHSGVINETSNFNYLPRFSLNEKYGDIDRVKFAANSKGMGIYELIPSDPLLTENPPFIGFSLIDTNLSKNLNCFVFDKNGNVELDKFLFEERVEIRLKRSLETGRVRMNCTSKTNDGYWRWFGQQFFLPSYLDQ